MAGPNRLFSGETAQRLSVLKGALRVAYQPTEYASPRMRHPSGKRVSADLRATQDLSHLLTRTLRKTEQQSHNRRTGISVDFDPSELVGVRFLVITTRQLEMAVGIEILPLHGERHAKKSLSFIERGTISATFRRDQHPLCQLARQCELRSPKPGCHQ